MTEAMPIINGWFSEICPLWPGSANSYQIDQILHQRKSRFQQIDVYETRHHGRMLVLDGIVQFTEFDEFTYQEMMAHLPLFAHPEPETVLVIGGGDGGVLREINRHKQVRTIECCEVDEAVVETSKAFFPGMACGFDDPRVQLHIEDGVTFVQARESAFDVIIVDSSDPVGPARALFEEPFYRSLKNALRPGGIIATQAESMFLHPDWVRKLASMTAALFNKQAYANILVPTYPGGHIGVCLGSLGPDPKTVNRPLPEKLQNQLRYYSPRVHAAAFVLPFFVEKNLSQI